MMMLVNKLTRSVLIIIFALVKDAGIFYISISLYVGTDYICYQLEPKIAIQIL
jgi:hypothetical protein